MTQATESTTQTVAANETIARKLAIAIDSWGRCQKKGNEWESRWEARIDYLIGLLPHGSGIDGKTELNYDKSSAQKLVIATEFHHMDQQGFYTEQTNHNLVLTTDLTGSLNLQITGRDKNQIKDYLGDIFHYAFTRTLTPEELAKHDAL